MIHTGVVGQMKFCMLARISLHCQDFHWLVCVKFRSVVLPGLFLNGKWKLV